MSIKAYHRKRHFDRTPEPPGARIRKTKKGPLIFVVQKHAATHLHYDFRLEMNGVLKSWAVPKGPSMHSRDKRLAIQTEDHPLEYADFEGAIPTGEYGAGTVLIWDKGIWLPEGDYEHDYLQGKINFTLLGEKLKGRWSLVQTASKKNEWLLFKASDSASHTQKQNKLLLDSPSIVSGRTLEEITTNSKNVAKSTTRENLEEEIIRNRIKKQGLPISKPLPLIKPELATLVSKVPRGQEWLHEVKFDGYRLFSYLNGDEVALITRNGNNWTEKFPNLVKILKELNLHGCILDGEIVALNQRNQISFQLLQNAIHFHEKAKLVYYVFDLPVCYGYDISQLSLVERKKILQKLIFKSPPSIQYSESYQGDETVFWETACHLGLEGIISKKIDSPYKHKRTKDWLKIKCVNQQEFLIIGYIPSKHDERLIQSLLLGYYDKAGRLQYCGHVGTGFSQKSLLMLHKELSSRIRNTENVNGNFDKHTIWVSPELIAEVKFSAWTDDNILRHASFLGLRKDKKPKEVVLERAKALQASEKQETSREMLLTKKEIDLLLSKINFTHKDKVLFSDNVITKEDLARYYLKISPWILPYIVNRPLMVLRCPEGQKKKCFFQKHYSETFLPNIYSTLIQEKHGSNTYLYIKDKEGLLELIQLGVIEIHAWESKIDNIENPDYIVFDLDPSIDTPWHQVIDCAFLLKSLLEKYQLKSFIKTSGKKGLHILVPLMPQFDWDQVRAFSKKIATMMVEHNPKIYTSTMSKNKRINKIFIDYFRNTRGATTVVNLSCRANPTAGISTSLSWKELTVLKAPDQYTIQNIIKRLSRLPHDPWQDFFQLQQRLPAI